jgi:hypothetical protein
VDICFIPTVYKSGKIKVRILAPFVEKYLMFPVSLQSEAIFNIMDVFDMSFDVEDTVDLDSLFADLGVSLSDLDTLVLDTE